MFLDEILRTGKPVRGERGLLAQGRVLDLYCFRVNDASNQRVGVIFTDVTARKRSRSRSDARQSGSRTVRLFPPATIYRNRCER